MKSDFLLLSASAIWGFSFVAQRVGMDYVGPFTFNAIRFALGGFVLVPFILHRRKKSAPDNNRRPVLTKKLLLPGLIAGLALFGGASFQQIGIIHTTAGKAGFITGLYVILVPVLGLFWKKRTHSEAWVGAVLAVAGLYFLSVTRDFTISYGDFLVLISAFFWAAHVQVIDRYVSETDPLMLACVQFLISSLFSTLVIPFTETVSFNSVQAAAIPLLYVGFLSTGVAYTLQVVAQRVSHPAHAAILLSLESVFAVLGGWLLLSESLSDRQLAGSALMLSGMIVAQLHIFSKFRVFGQTPGGAGRE